MTDPYRTGHCAVVIDGTVLVAAGSYGSKLNDVWRSSDGMTWIQVTSSASFSPRAGHGCAVVGTQMVLVGGYGSTGYLNDVWVSPDMGSSWTQMAADSFAARYFFGIAAFLGKLWVIGGSGSSYYNEAWYSDSTSLGNWTLANAAAVSFSRFGLGVTVFNNRMWLAAGFNGYEYLNDVWR